MYGMVGDGFLGLFASAGLSAGRPLLRTTLGHAVSRKARATEDMSDRYAAGLLVLQDHRDQLSPPMAGPREIAP